MRIPERMAGAMTKSCLVLGLVAVTEPLGAQTFTIQGNLAATQIQLSNQDLGTCNSTTQGTTIFQTETSSSGGHLILCARDSPGSSNYHWYVVSLQGMSATAIVYGRAASGGASPGDVVVFGANSEDSVERARVRTSGPGLIGVIPSPIPPQPIPDGYSERVAMEAQGKIAVALTGVVTTKVRVPPGSVIQVGDRIAVSEVAGFSQKAAPGDLPLGTAVEVFSPKASTCRKVRTVEEIDWARGGCAQLEDGVSFAEVRVAWGLVQQAALPGSSERRIAELEQALCSMKKDLSFCR